MKKNLISLLVGLICSLSSLSAHALCLVINADNNGASSLTHFVEVGYSNKGTLAACAPPKTQGTYGHYDHQIGFNQSILFETPQTTCLKYRDNNNNGKLDRGDVCLEYNITETKLNSPLVFNNKDQSLVIGNFATAMPSDIGAAWNHVYPANYLLSSIDLGTVIIDAAGIEQGKLPLECADPTSIVVLRSLTIKTNGFGKAALLDQQNSKTKCFKDGGNLTVIDVASNPNPTDCTPAHPDYKAYYQDGDRDSHGDAEKSTQACQDPSTDDVKYVLTSDDCNDGDASSYLPPKWYPDVDGDGYGAKDKPSKDECKKPGNYVNNNEDCYDEGNDAANINPNATEIPGNDVDENCDNTKAPNSDSNASDDDGDGYCEGVNLDNDPELECVDEQGNPDETIKPGDCADTPGDGAEIYPKETETECADGKNNDCDADGLDLFDKDCAHGNKADDDGDTYCDGSEACASGDPAKNKDCDDTDGNINKDAVEDCDDGIDNDCDEKIDGDDTHCQADPKTIDDDKDGQTENDGDCDDADPARKKGNIELCTDDKDNDCDEAKNEGCNADPSEDNDDDGFCEGVDLDGDGTLDCVNDQLEPGDCDDMARSVNPDQIELCDDNVDNDCDGNDVVRPKTDDGSSIGSSFLKSAEEIEVEFDFTDPISGLACNLSNGEADSSSSSSGCGCDMSGRSRKANGSDVLLTVMMLMSLSVLARLRFSRREAK